MSFSAFWGHLYTTAEPEPWHLDEKDWRLEQVEIQMCPTEIDEQAQPRSQRRQQSEPWVGSPTEEAE